MFVLLTRVIAGESSALLNKNMIFRMVDAMNVAPRSLWKLSRIAGPNRYFERLDRASRNKASNDPALSLLPAPILAAVARAFSAAARW
jgi:hypothetical protein